MPESTFALIKDGIVSNLIFANSEDTSFFEQLYSEEIADIAIELTEENFLDVTNRPEIGWSFQDGKFLPPNQ